MKSKDELLKIPHNKGETEILRALPGLKVLDSDGNAVSTELSQRILNPITPGKSGLSIDHVIGCPLGCAYCVRHNFGAFKITKPHLVESDEEVVQRLLRHRLFKPHKTPLRIFTQATDAMVPSVKPHLFNTLRLLDEQKLTNHMLIITRYKVTPEDCERLNSFRHLKVSLLITYSGIRDRRIEPISEKIAVNSLKTSFANSERFKVVTYWRPIICGLNDSDKDIDFVLKELSQHCHSIVFSGLYQTKQIKDFFAERGVDDLYDGHVDRRKIFPDQLEQRILDRCHGTPAYGILFRKTSCGVLAAHGVPDFNAHYCVGHEICGICPETQRKICKSAHRTPKAEEVMRAANEIGIAAPAIDIRQHLPMVSTGISAEERYYLRHVLSHIVEDAKFPHASGQNGRADALRHFESTDRRE